MPPLRLSEMHYRPDLLLETLHRVVQTVFQCWDKLPEADRQTVDRLRRELADRLAAESNRLQRSILILNFLQQLERIGPVVQVAREAFAAGKSAEPVRATGIVSDDQVHEAVTTLHSTPGSATAKGIHLRPSGREETMLESAFDWGDEAATSFELPTATVGREESGPPTGERAEGVADGEGGETVQFHTRVDFPAQVRPDVEEVLIVQLTLERPAESRVSGEVGITFADPQEPEMVEVRVTAPGFSERTGIWSRTIAVYTGQDSQPAIFLLTAPQQTGLYRITVDFYHRGRVVGSGAFQTHVTRFVTDVETGMAAVHPLAGLPRLPDNPPPPADLELRIVKGNDDNTLDFTLHSFRGKVGYHWRRIGQVQLIATDPRQFLEGILQELSQLAADPADALSEAEAQTRYDHIQRFGERLYDDLFPPEMKAEYWRIKKLRQERDIRSLLITSDEPWIPWELVKPYRFNDDTLEEEHDGFLAEEFELCRWLAGRGPADQVQIRSARLVAPRLDLAYVEEEKAYFDGLGARGIDIGDLLRTRDEVLQAARQGGLQLLHFAAHGTFTPEYADESPLMLQDSALRPTDFQGSYGLGLRRERPLVFLNACHSAQMAFVLTRLGGWAETLVDRVGVGVFIGTLWEVNDELAADFARQFYDNLWAGQSLGESFHNARLHIRDRQRANPTWLAYTLYGDPNSHITFRP